MEKATKEERKLWGEVLRVARTNWGEAVQAWVHVLALRVFVETVLRYGLPLSFVCGLIKVLTSLSLPYFISMEANGRLEVAMLIKRTDQRERLQENSNLPRPGILIPRWQCAR